MLLLVGNRYAPAAARLWLYVPQLTSAGVMALVYPRNCMVLGS